MKVKVNPNVCIGCGACQAVAPDVFEVNDEGVAEAIITDEISMDLVEDATDAKEGCPVNAIYDPEEEEMEEAA